MLMFFWSKVGEIINLKGNLFESPPGFNFRKFEYHITFFRNFFGYFSASAIDTAHILNSSGRLEKDPDFKLNVHPCEEI